MGKRPNFNEIKSYHEFAKYYWYREELSNICKQIGIDDTGSKN
ncbi:SAP domain-containing protein [[Clostridium] symbiosum]|nr:SAP domain-containing protein [[Clostridium] symbiosum]MCB6350700.1 SAP domain-containing protein [[Clostridium] symbiosum]